MEQTWYDEGLRAEVQERQVTTNLIYSTKYSSAPNLLILLPVPFLSARIGKKV